MIKQAQTATASATGKITWTCRACGEPIKNGKGWATVSRRELDQYERDIRAWEAAHPRTERGWRVVTGRELVELPEKVKWYALHETCTTDEDEDATWRDYWFEIERCDTVAKFLHWTGHLLTSHRSHVVNTDWPMIAMSLGADA